MPETTAILAIIKEKTGEKGNLQTRYIGMVSYEGMGYLPALLPMFRTPQPIDRYKEDLNKMVLDFRDEIQKSKKLGPINLEEPLVKIGKYICNQFGLKRIFDLLFSQSNLQNLIIITDDPSVPWLWTYSNKEKKFLCERFAYGKIFIEDICKSLDNPIVQGRKEYQEYEDYLKNRCALILAGDWQHVKERYPDRYLENVSKEVKSIKGYLERKLPAVKEIYGNSVDFYDFLEGEAMRLKIVHYCGHIDSRGLLLGPEEDEIISPARNNYSGIRLHSKPLFFLNGCHSGEIKVTERWERDANLATSFMEMGASGCIVTMMPVSDRLSSQFAIDFYNQVLEKNCSIGEALVKVREEQAKDKNKTNDLTRLFFNLYGDPRIKLTQKPTFKESLAGHFERPQKEKDEEIIDKLFAK